MRTLILVLLFVSTHIVAQDYPMGMNWGEQSYQNISCKAQYGTCVAYAAAYELSTTMLAKNFSLADKNKILYSSASPGFKVKEGASGYVVPLIVELTHL